MIKQTMTLRSFIREQSGTFSAKDIFNGYLRLKPSLRIDVVRRQLDVLAENGELSKHKKGLNVLYSSHVKRVSFIAEFNSLVSSVRNYPFGSPCKSFIKEGV